MAETEKQSIQNMSAAIATLPEEKKQFFIGFAEGVAAMADQVKGSGNRNTAQAVAEIQGS